MINIDFLQYLIEYSKTENLTRASKSLHVSQSALTRAMQKVEDYVGVPIFDRTKNRLSLNDTGKELVCIVKLKSKTERHTANPDQDFQTLKNMVTSLRNKELIENWIKEKQKETYIFINPEYRDCQFTYPGWIKE